MKFIILLILFSSIFTWINCAPEKKQYEIKFEVDEEFDVEEFEIKGRQKDNHKFDPHFGPVNYNLPQNQVIQQKDESTLLPEVITTIATTATVPDIKTTLNPVKNEEAPEAKSLDEEERRK